MAISTIQVRRGKREDFKPGEMLPGEWAVSIDNDTENQMVWMCFAPGVVKRMGTYEDFVAQVAEATADVRDEYKAEFDEIKKQIDATAETVQSNKDTVVTISNSIVNTYLPRIQEYATRAETGATNAGKSATDAEKWAKQAESFAHGGTDVREEEDTDNAKYYYEQAKRISQGLSGALLPMGTISYSELKTALKSPGYMYNISDAFTTDDTFKEGAGHHYPAGTNVYLTVDEYWDCLAGYQVVSVNNKTGAVTLTKDDVGLGKVENLSSAEILGKMTKGNVTNALGYTPAGGQGVNLLTGTNSENSLGNGFWENHSWGNFSGGNGTIESISISDCPDPTIKRGWRISGNTTGNKDIGQQNVPLTKGKKYTVSCYVKAINGNPTLLIRINGDKNIIITNETISNVDYKLFFKTFTLDSNDNIVQFGLSGSGGDIEICGMKLEPGTVTDPVWTPALEDVVVKSEFNSYIVNGEIITSRDGTAKGFGTATIVTLPNKLAMVYFDAKVTTAGSNDTGRWGISSKTLKKINTNVPNIIPMFGGSINIFKNGIKDSDLNGYGACMSSDNDYWAPCRMYDFNNVTFGPWADSIATVDLQINGVCFGTVSEVTATADEPSSDTEIN